MFFGSLEFLVFLPIFLLAYFLTSGKNRLWVNLIGSYIFYGWFDWRFLSILILITVVNYWAALKTSDEMARHGGKPGRESKRWLTLSVVVCMGMLAYFKYANFFLDNVYAVLSALGIHGRHAALEITLPLGISFFTFQGLSYTIDVFRGRLEVERSLLRLAVFKAFFPQLVAGPIVRASTFLPQLWHDRKPTLEGISRGTAEIAWGFVLKFVVAESLALVVEPRFEAPEAHNGLSLFLGVISYSFQIYGDFAGYSLMAIGLARWFGFEFPENFNAPYFARDFSDFWRRWHISLSTWIRDYIYIPLGGNRISGGRTYANLMIAMLLGGLWHGASWNFVIWGGLHGLFLSAQRALEKPLHHLWALFPKFAAVAIQMAGCYALVCLTWVFFRAKDLPQSMEIIRAILNFQDYAWAGVSEKFHIMRAVAVIALVVGFDVANLNHRAFVWMEERPFVMMGFVVGCLLLLAFLGVFGNDAFIYFQF